MKKNISPMKLYLLLASLYLLLVLLAPANKAAMAIYHLSSYQYHILVFLVVLPGVISWFFGFYSYSKLRLYANTVRQTAEGEGFDMIARGTAWLVGGLAGSAIVSIILNTVANSHHDFLSAASVINNYLNILVPLIAFWFISRGARHLAEHTKARITVSDAKFIILVFAALGAVFCYLVFRHLNLDSLTTTNNAYHLPAWLIITTVIIPCLYAWFSGLLAAYEIIIYSRRVAGVFYRQSMRFVAAGFLAVIASFVGIQYLRSAIPRTGHISLNAALIAIILIYICMAIGYALISIGANRLKKIEDI